MTGVIPRRHIKLFRKVGGYYSNNGMWRDESEVQIQILASVQPASPEDLEMLPEGRRQARAFRLFTSQEIKAGRADQNPDQVELFGERYEVLSAENWRNNIINHYSGIAVRLDEQVPSENGGDPYVS